MRVSNDPYEPVMSPSTPSRKPRRVRPQDPAIWVWAAVALIALVPLQHAVASRLERVHPHTVQPAARGEAATPTAADAATRPPTAAQAPVGAGIATP
jgi:hypothetical protein